MLHYLLITLYRRYTLNDLFDGHLQKGSAYEKHVDGEGADEIHYVYVESNTRTS